MVTILDTVGQAAFAGLDLTTVVAETTGVGKFVSHNKKKGGALAPLFTVTKSFDSATKVLTGGQNVPINSFTGADAPPIDGDKND